MANYKSLNERSEKARRRYHAVNDIFKQGSPSEIIAFVEERDGSDLEDSVEEVIIMEDEEGVEKEYFAGPDGELHEIWDTPDSGDYDWGGDPDEWRES